VRESDRFRGANVCKKEILKDRGKDREKGVGSKKTEDQIGLRDRMVSGAQTSEMEKKKKRGLGTPDSGASERRIPGCQEGDPRVTEGFYA